MHFMSPPRMGVVAAFPRPVVAASPVTVVLDSCTAATGIRSLNGGIIIVTVTIAKLGVSRIVIAIVQNVVPVVPKIVVQVIIGTGIIFAMVIIPLRIGMIILRSGVDSRAVWSACRLWASYVSTTTNQSVHLPYSIPKTYLSQQPPWPGTLWRLRDLLSVHARDRPDRYI